MVEMELINRIDTNNMKALGILQVLLFTLINGGEYDKFDIVSTLEAVQDYLMDTNKIFDAET